MNLLKAGLALLLIGLVGYAMVSNVILIEVLNRGRQRRRLSLELFPASAPVRFLREWKAGERESSRLVVLWVWSIVISFGLAVVTLLVFCVI